MKTEAFFNFGQSQASCFPQLPVSMLNEAHHPAADLITDLSSLLTLDVKANEHISQNVDV